MQPLQISEQLTKRGASFSDAPRRLYTLREALLASAELSLQIKAFPLTGTASIKLATV
jgi:hypothetical protein